MAKTMPSNSLADAELDALYSPEMIRKAQDDAQACFILNREEWYRIIERLNMRVQEFECAEGAD